MVNTEDVFKFENLEVENDEISGVLSLNESLPFFEGHFPENPVLPAVSMVDASFELLRKKFPDKIITDIQLKRCKFMKMVHPNQEIVIHAQSKDQKQWKVIWESKENREVFAHLNLMV